MANPSSITTVTIGDFKFNALSTQVGISTHHDDNGMPMMGSLRFVADVTVDIHDTVAISFATLSGLFDLANVATKSKIKPVKIQYWRDELQQDAVCTYTFDGWISSFTTTSGSGSNHELHLHIQPDVASGTFYKLTMGN